MAAYATANEARPAEAAAAIATATAAWAATPAPDGPRVSPSQGFQPTTRVRGPVAANPPDGPFGPSDRLRGSVLRRRREG